MNEDSRKLYRLLYQDCAAEGRALAQWASDMLDRYPYFPLPATLTLSDAPESAAKRLTEARLALATSDPAALQRFVDPACETFDDIYPAENAPEPISTEGAISTFLDTYGHTSPQEDALLERLIMNPVPDYAQLLDQEERASLPDAEAESDDPRNRLIDKFILQSRAAEPSSTAAPAEPIGQVEAPAEQPQQSLLSESLAKIYIKQRRYDRAYEIISQLSLNFPEKNVYFADQLRFLRKLIINQQHQQQKPTK